MVCLDTTFLVDLFRKDPDAEKILFEFVDKNVFLTITVMTVGELYYGAYKSEKCDEKKLKVKQFIKNFPILEMNELAAEKFGEILSSLECAGQKIGDRDVVIGAISLSKGENVIVTRNGKHFSRIPGITVLTY